VPAGQWQPTGQANKQEGCHGWVVWISSLVTDLCALGGAVGPTARVLLPAPDGIM
jgi:hypothetical protein